MAGLEDYPSQQKYPYDPDMWESRYRSKYVPEINRESEYISTPSNFNYSQNYSQQPEPDEEDDDIVIKKYVGIGVGLVSLITENLLSHPFLVLRRQCQVHNTSKRYHLTPITLIPVIVHLHQRQGITTLWKGIGSVLLIRGMTLAVEDFISKVTPWPKEISCNTSLKAFGQHLLLKCISLSIVTPFYSASLVETVQSDIASEKPGILDVFKEGAVRLLSWGVPQKGRMLPVWALVGPTMGLGLAKYLFGLIVRGSTSRIMRTKCRLEQEKRGALSKDTVSQSAAQNIEINSALIAMITTDVIFYPFETILHRLHLQGTRTIVDNLDTGYSVLPILTNYQGPSDCYEITVSNEGVCGLYKGFGALLLQFAAHVAVIKMTKYVITELMQLMRPSPPKPAQRQTPQTIYSTIQIPTERYLIP